MHVESIIESIQPHKPQLKVNKIKAVIIGCIALPDIRSLNATCKLGLYG